MKKIKRELRKLRYRLKSSIQRTPWLKLAVSLGKALGIIALVLLLSLLVYWAIRSDIAPQWTGFGPYNENIQGPRSKTLWQWFELLLVPFFVSVSVMIGAWWLERSEGKVAHEINKENQNQATLENYFQRMENLLLDNGLLDKSDALVVHTLARAWTLAVLRYLDSKRKGLVVQFLYEAGLINGEKPLISLTGADLSEADLSRLQLPGINLQGTILNRAMLQESNLTEANLSSVSLRDADVTMGSKPFPTTLLNRVNLSGSDLSGSDMTNVLMADAKLIGTRLERVKLLGANLAGSEIKHTRFEKTNLKGVHFNECDMYESWFVNCDLQRTDFSKAIILSCYIRDSNLQHANMTGAKITITSFSGTNAKNAKIDPSQIDRTRWYKAVLPDGKKYASWKRFNEWIKGG